MTIVEVLILPIECNYKDNSCETYRGMLIINCSEALSIFF